MLDLLVSKSRKRTRVALALLALILFALIGAAPGVGAQGPLPEPILPTGLSVRLEDFVQVPPTSFFRPLARTNILTHAGDGSGRLFVNDMRGRIYVIEAGVLAATPFLDVQGALGGDLATQGLQLGVSTFAFHPDYATPGAPGSGRFYTAHSETPASGTPDFPSPTGLSTHHSVISEWAVSPSNPNRIDPSSKRELLRVAEPTRDHNVGQIAFNPNARPGDADYGLLYVCQGDGGYPVSPGLQVDPNRTAQDRSNPFGSILRIDPLGSNSVNGAYGIPADNPFVGSSDGSLGEIWAYGLRNPHRFSWDSGGGGTMLISDIGQTPLEEVNIGRPGANYGWSERQGTFAVDHDDPLVFLPLPPDDEAFGYSYPVAQYDQEEGRAIVGGFVYRGAAMPALRGRYIFGDLTSGRIFYVDVDELVEGRQAEIRELTLFYQGEQTTLLEILGGDFRADLRFGQGEDGELYVLTKRDGRVRRLLAGPPVEVEADIKPGDEQNPVNTFSRGVVPVAVLGSNSFDAAEIDPATLAFGPGGAPPAHRKGGHAEDVNGDGLTDLLSHYRVPRSGIAAGDREACVSGETFDGIPFRGCDSIQTVPGSACGIGPGLAPLLLALLGVGGLRRPARRDLGARLG